MKYLLTAFVVVVGLVAGWSDPASAQLNRTWVSRTGSDSNSCDVATPCASFSFALSKTNPGGTIMCADSGLFVGAFTIAKSVTIDCTEEAGEVSASITIAFDSFSQSDPTRVVRLRNITFAGLNQSASAALSITGSGANTTVVIEDCLIDGYLTGGTGQRGIYDQRTGGGNLFIGNTTIRNMAGTAIAVYPSSGQTSIIATLDHVTLFKTLLGVGVGGSSYVEINRSMISHNTTGIEIDSGFASIDNSVITLNNTGIFNQGSTSMHSSTLSFNGNATSGRAIQSTVTNHVFGNSGATPLLSAAGGPTSPAGLQ